jgi:hypothetical protein
METTVMVVNVEEEAIEVSVERIRGYRFFDPVPEVSGMQPKYGAIRHCEFGDSLRGVRQVDRQDCLALEVQL